MFKHDADFLWKPSRVFIPAWNFHLSQDALSGNAANADTVLISAASASNWGEINSLGLMGLDMSTAAEEVNTLWALPPDLDITKPIEARVHWTSGSADVADTIDWKLRYLKITPNVTVIISAATDLDTVIAQDTVPVATAYAYCATEWGAILPAVTAISNKTEAIEFEVEMDAKAAGLAEAVFFLGLELRYTPKRLQGPDGMKRAAKAPTYMLGNTYAN